MSKHKKLFPYLIGFFVIFLVILHRFLTQKVTKKRYKNDFKQITIEWKQFFDNFLHFSQMFYQFSLDNNRKRKIFIKKLFLF